MCIQDLRATTQTEIKINRARGEAVYGLFIDIKVRTAKLCQLSYRPRHTIQAGMDR